MSLNLAEISGNTFSAASLKWFSVLTPFFLSFSSGRIFISVKNQSREIPKYQSREIAIEGTPERKASLAPPTVPE